MLQIIKHKVTSSVNHILQKIDTTAAFDDRIFPNTAEWNFCILSRVLRRLERFIFITLRALYIRYSMISFIRQWIDMVTNLFYKILLLPFYSYVNKISLQKQALRRDNPSSLMSARMADEPDIWPELDISVVIHNSESWLCLFFNSLLNQNYPLDKINLYIVDNGSCDGSVSLIKNFNELNRSCFASIRLVLQNNIGFGAGHNLSISYGTSQFCLVTNPDLRFLPDSLTLVVRQALADHDGHVACWELRQFPYEHHKHYDPVTFETDWCSHACVLLRRSAFLHIGGYDPALFMYAEDVEISYRLRSFGYSLLYVPYACVMHYAYAFPDQRKQQQILGSCRGNLYLRLRYGSVIDGVGGILLCIRRACSPGLTCKTRRAVICSIPRMWSAARNPRRNIGPFAAPFPFYAFEYAYSREGAFWKQSPLPPATKLPRISVLVRTYAGREEFLRQSLRCLLHQTYPLVEIIVAEDGGETMRQLVGVFGAEARKGVEVRYLPCSKMGRSGVGNAAMLAATGEYICFLDDDDLLYADHLETLFAALVDNPTCVAAYAPGTEVLTEHKPGDTNFLDKEYRRADILFQKWDYDILKHHNYLLVQTLFRRNCFLENGGFDEKIDAFEDWDLWLRYGHNSNFAYVPKVTSLFRTPYELNRRLLRCRQYAISHEARKAPSEKSYEQLKSASFCLAVLTLIQTFLLFFFCLTLCACSVPLEPLPHLPRKDWLNPQDSQTYSKTVSGGVTYAPDKIFSFRELIYLAIQQSPILAKSRVNLDVQKIAVSDARWNALPEVHLLAVISNNITQYNQSLADKANAQAAKRHTTSAYKDYGKTAYQISFTGVFNNPVATYFNVQAQNELMDIAITKHKEVVGDCINQIANILIKINGKLNLKQNLEKYLEDLQKNKMYKEISEQYHVDFMDSISSAADMADDLALQIDAVGMELTTLRNQLKRFVGLDRMQKLKVDLKNIESIIESYSFTSLDWEQSWESTPTRLMLAQQIRLHDAGIMLAWAQYVPTISFVVNENPPRGQSQPVGAETDQFLHVTLNFPLVDWGHRYRQSATSRERKRQSRLDEMIQRDTYHDSWCNAEEQLALSEARLKQREHAVLNAERRLKIAEAHWESGTILLPALNSLRKQYYDAKNAAIEARTNMLLMKLQWMKLAQTLLHKFIDS